MEKAPRGWQPGQARGEGQAEDSGGLVGEGERARQNVDALLERGRESEWPRREASAGDGEG
eukprot:1719268-Alexandrium_andersonii.AAC.1